VFFFKLLTYKPNGRIEIVILELSAIFLLLTSKIVWVWKAFNTRSN